MRKKRKGGGTQALGVQTLLNWLKRRLHNLFNGKEYKMERLQS